MWSLAGSQAVDQPIQQLCAWKACSQPVLCLGSAQLADPASLGLSLWAGLGCPGTESGGTGSEVLGLWVEQLASAPDALPPEVSGVGAPLGFHVWALSSLICMRTTGPQVSARAAYTGSAVQGRRGEGRQGPRLLPRVL